MEEAGFREEDFLKPLVKNLSGLYIGSAREKLIKDGILYGGYHYRLSAQ